MLSPIDEKSRINMSFDLSDKLNEGVKRMVS